MPDDSGAPGGGLPREDIPMNDTLHAVAPDRAEPAAIDAPATDLRSDERTWAAAAHLAALVAALMTSWFAGVAGAIAAFVVWLLARDKSTFAATHAKEALNFNVSMFLYVVASIVLVVFTLGIGLIVALPIWAALAILWLVCTIIATVKAYDGEVYRYPLTLRLF